ncbi:MAG: ATPase [Sphingobacteriales bacterium]|jgi:hypothetical protein|nr:ATPase [Sphingobacteriales bacterium]MBP9142663.1 ATPase [Chitinophagales bacterium]MDA0198704.1 START-like domain-containing protein [Bacteroidota bacterium]MBK6889037.1 ATPase [Sphingobacteriales bacterium]MBK7528460.1 ATPase [Sphingobacteriales bacterium]
MAREKFSVDFIVKSSPVILYEFLATVTGLSEWFAEWIEERDDMLIFGWGKSSERAIVLDYEDHHFIKFKFLDNPENEFLEFRIEKSPITEDTILIITDFAEKRETDDQIALWESQVEALIMRIGAGN